MDCQRVNIMNRRMNQPNDTFKAGLKSSGDLRARIASMARSEPRDVDKRDRQHL